MSLLDFKSSCPQSGTVGSIPTHLRQTALKLRLAGQNTEANCIWLMIANRRQETEGRVGSRELREKE